MRVADGPRFPRLVRDGFRGSSARPGSISGGWGRPQAVRRAAAQARSWRARATASGTVMAWLMSPLRVAAGCGKGRIGGRRGGGGPVVVGGGGAVVAGRRGGGGLAGDGGEGGGVEEQTVATVGWADGVAEGADVGVDGAAVAAASAAGAEFGHRGGYQDATVVAGTTPLVGQVEQEAAIWRCARVPDPGGANGGHGGPAGLGGAGQTVVRAVGWGLWVRGRQPPRVGGRVRPLATALPGRVASQPTSRECFLNPADRIT